MFAWPSVYGMAGKHSQHCVLWYIPWHTLGTYWFQHPCVQRQAGRDILAGRPTGSVRRSSMRGGGTGGGGTGTAVRHGWAPPWRVLPRGGRLASCQLICPGEAITAVSRATIGQCSASRITARAYVPCSSWGLCSASVQISYLHGSTVHPVCFECFTTRLTYDWMFSGCGTLL